MGVDHGRPRGRRRPPPRSAPAHVLAARARKRARDREWDALTDYERQRIERVLHGLDPEPPPGEPMQPGCRQLDLAEETPLQAPLFATQLGGRRR